MALGIPGFHREPSSMIGVSVEVRRFVSENQPGWVECWLTDANGLEWSFVEKVPVVSSELLTAETDYPRLGVIACQIVERRIGAGQCEVVLIDTEQPWGVEATTGETRFFVRPAQLNELQ